MNETEILAYPIVQPPGAILVSQGMMLRDAFAAACDITMYSIEIDAWRAMKGSPTVQEIATCIAAVRYAEADAMLTMRSPAASTEPEPTPTEPTEPPTETTGDPQ